MAGARQAHEKALAGAPDTPGVLWNLALLAEREGNSEEAEELLEKLLAVKADWEDAAFRLGFLQLQRGEYAGAVDSFEICLKKRKDWVEALLNLGLAFWKFEDLEGAAQTFNRVLALQPHNPDALRALTADRHRAQESEAGLGAASEGAWRWADARRSCPSTWGCCCNPPATRPRRRNATRRRLIDQTRFPQALLNLGHALKATGKEDEARQAWSRAVTADPELAAEYFN